MSVQVEHQGILMSYLKGNLLPNKLKADNLNEPQGFVSSRSICSRASIKFTGLKYRIKTNDCNSASYHQSPSSASSSSIKLHNTPIHCFWRKCDFNFPFYGWSAHVSQSQNISNRGSPFSHCTMNKHFLFNCWGGSDSLSSAAGLPWSLHGDRMKQKEKRMVRRKNMVTGL